MWQHDASILVQELARGCDEDAKTSLMSPVVYDTAWVSVIVKTDESGRAQWLFPQSFQAVQESQEASGAWGNNTSEVDGILNTMAALLALLRHRKQSDVHGCPELPSDIDLRINKAEKWLETSLLDWDVAASEHVGFEILIPSLLELLAKENIRFKFPGKDLLTTLNHGKLAKVDMAMLYASQKSTLIHSLEAFIDTLDFDKVGHHLTSGSMMGSPSSTAAYLMGARPWNLEAEDYLRKVLCNGPGQGSGWFPSAFPTTIFTLSWTLSTLLLAGYRVDEMGKENCMKLSCSLEGALNAKGGIVGFDADFMPDADDTARAILTLNLLGKADISLNGLIQEFEMDKCFRTYRSERNPSSSANANVLLAFLYSPNPRQNQSQIRKAVTFLCDTWWAGTMKDKWNVSFEYQTMLLTQAFIRILHTPEDDTLEALLPDSISHQVRVVLAQILTRTLKGQRADGSWGQLSCEITAFAIITLNKLVSVPWTESLRPKIEQAISEARSFLLQNRPRWSNAGSIWIEKVSYASSILSQTYCLAALKCTPIYPIPRFCMREGAEKVTKVVNKGSEFFSRLPLFHNLDDWELKSSLVESNMFLEVLRQRKSDIFPRTGMTEDKYLEYIPFIWTGCNNLGTLQLSNAVLWEMMLISMINYQVDEYMEAVVGELSPQELDRVEDIVTQLCRAPATKTRPPGSLQHADADDREPINGFHPSSDTSDTSSSLSEISKILFRFTAHTLTHPSFLASSYTHQTFVRQELVTFLLAHIYQVRDNARFVLQRDATTFSTPGSDYYDWIHSVSAPHTSCAYSFAFFTCLISAPSEEDTFSTAKEKYLVRDVVRHLAAMCRMYNDYGSIARDEAERNLNSVDFPEFARHGGSSGRKEELIWLAEYERECLESALRRLEKEVKAKSMSKLKVFVDVTDLFGQIYVARDIASRIK